VSLPLEPAENLESLPHGDNWRMGKKQISKQVGELALASGDQPTAVRYLLQQIGTEAPGGAVELRVPPFGAVQCIGGLDHRRGTPPNVVELSPDNFLALVFGRVGWDELVRSGQLVASGVLADELRNLFPRTEVR